MDCPNTYSFELTKSIMFLLDFLIYTNVLPITYVEMAILQSC